MDRIVDIYFVGGFGTVQWIVPTEYLTSNPDEIVLSNPNKILQVRKECLRTCSAHRHPHRSKLVRAVGMMDRKDYMKQAG